MNGVGKLACERAHGGFGGRLGRCADQIGDGFGLRQVHFVVEKSALGEFARLRKANVGNRIQTTAQQQLHHHGTAVSLQFQHMLTRVGMRCRKIQCDAVVNRCTVGIHKCTVVRAAWRECALTHRVHQCVYGRRCARCANHADPTLPCGGGDGDNGVIVCGVVLINGHHGVGSFIVMRR